MFRVLKAGQVSSLHVDPETAVRAAAAVTAMQVARGEAARVEVRDATGAVIWRAASQEDAVESGAGPGVGSGLGDGSEPGEFGRPPRR